MTTITHTPLDCTPAQRANLAKLAAYLRGNADKVRPHFDMSTFRTVDESVTDEDEDGYVLAGQDIEPDDIVNGTLLGTCNSVGCAIGHGPEAGIHPGSSLGWGDYGRDKFGIQGPTDVSANAFLWMFAGSWFNRDNTPEGAADRIDYTLQHGVPSNFAEQMRGDDPLIYRT